MNKETNMEKQTDEVFCPECGKPIKKKAVICPYCGIKVK
jgi:DNA-directed RNA polymerase subunit RPC12/RpoP